MSKYYEPPPENIFKEVREKATELWREIDTDNDKYGYASEKINRIKNLWNVRDNFMYMVAMFDVGNQRKLADKISQEARQAIRKRMVDVDYPTELIVF